MASEELQKVLEMLKSLPPETGLSIAEQRAAFEARPRFTLAEDIQCEKVNAGGVPAEWISSNQVDKERIIFFLHGGGYVMGSIDTHREIISRLSQAAKARILAIDYRLAPENPFPAAVDDSVTAYRWLLSLGVDHNRIAIAGDSAGGGLAIATLVALRDGGEPLPAAGICISPWADLECNWEFVTSEDEGMPTRNVILRMANSYCGQTDPRTPLVSPIHADLTCLPPLLIQVGTAGDLFDDATRLAEQAKKANVDVTLEQWDEMFHVWHMFAAILPEGQEAIEHIGDFIIKHTG